MPRSLRDIGFCHRWMITWLFLYGHSECYFGAACHTGWDGILFTSHAQLLCYFLKDMLWYTLHFQNKIDIDSLGSGRPRLAICKFPLKAKLWWMQVVSLSAGIQPRLWYWYFPGKNEKAQCILKHVLRMNTWIWCFDMILVYWCWCKRLQHQPPHQVHFLGRSVLITLRRSVQLYFVLHSSNRPAFSLAYDDGLREWAWFVIRRGNSLLAGWKLSLPWLDRLLQHAMMRSCALHIMIRFSYHLCNDKQRPASSRAMLSSRGTNARFGQPPDTAIMSRSQSLCLMRTFTLPERQLLGSSAASILCFSALLLICFHGAKVWVWDELQLL